MQIPILNGSYTDNDPAIRVSYPVNYAPVFEENGISQGYLKPSDGIIESGIADGSDRGGINWNEVLYRVMGSKLISINKAGAHVVIGDVGNNGKDVSFDYSFDRLGISSNGNLYYYDGSTLSQVTDVDLGVCLDIIWIDGYWMSTDGEFLVVSDINDPTSFNPLKYGSSEIDPDPIEALLKLRNEVNAVNRYTIEKFTNIGGSAFPFQRITGAQIQKGATGTHACDVFMEAIAFVGGGRNEQPSVYLGINGNAQKIATKEIDDILKGYTELQLSLIKVESMNDSSGDSLYIHLPDQTLVYDGTSSQGAGTPVWYILSSSIGAKAKYKAQSFVYVYDRWNVGDPTSTKHGYLSATVGSHWGQKVTWEFGTSIIYNESNGAIFNELELVALTGRNALGDNSTISTSYSLDGLQWSQPRSIAIGTIGQRLKRLRWPKQGIMRNWRVQRFQGDSDSHVSFVRLEAKLEQLQR